MLSTLLQNLLLWWNFRAILRGCAFFLQYRYIVAVKLNLRCCCKAAIILGIVIGSTCHINFINSFLFWRQHAQASRCAKAMVCLVILSHPASAIRQRSSATGLDHRQGSRGNAVIDSRQQCGRVFNRALFPRVQHENSRIPG